MNKMILFSVLIFGFSSVNAQWGDHLDNMNGYLSVGYGYMSPSSKGLDDFTSRYNSQRKLILSKEMESVWMSGMTYNTGISSGGILLEIGYTSRKGKMSAEADPAKVTPGSTTKREIELKYGAYNFTIGFLVGEGLLYMGPFFDLTVSSIDFETTNASAKTIVYEMDGYIGANIGAMLVLGNIANTGAYLTIRPYYSFGISQPNWKNLYEVTSTNYPDEDLESTKGGFGGFNIDATFSLNIACF